VAWYNIEFWDSFLLGVVPSYFIVPGFIFRRLLRVRHGCVSIASCSQPENGHVHIDFSIPEWFVRSVIGSLVSSKGSRVCAQRGMILLAAT